MGIYNVIAVYDLTFNTGSAHCLYSWSVENGAVIKKKWNIIL